MAIVRDADASVDALAIAEKYEAFVTYVYKCMENCPREHRVVRDVAIAALFTPVEGLYTAARSQHISRLHAVDGQFAALRFHLRFLDRQRIMTRRQHAHALALLAEAGKMLGAWKRKLGSGRAGK